MKKYLFIILYITVTNYIYGQGLNFSVVFDPQITWINSDAKNINKDVPRFGFNAGLVMDNFFDENYAFSTGISIWNTGGTLLYEDSTSILFRSGEEVLPPNTLMTYKLQYITIPFSLKLNSNQIGYISFFAHLGINSHINIKATADVTSVNIDNENISDEIQLFSMSYFIGGGVEYSLGGNTALIAGIYYHSGIWDITKSTSYRATLNNLSLRLGIKF